MSQVNGHDLRRAAKAAAAGDHGAALKILRTAHGWTQAELGKRTRLSTAQVSRYETGATPLASVAVMRMFAQALQIPPAVFGLTCDDTTTAPRAGIVAARNGGDLVDRRQLLAGVAGVAGLALVPVPALAAEKVTSGIDALLFGVQGPAAAPLKLAQLQNKVTTARRHMAACRYRELAAALPDLIRTATATRDDQPHDQRAAAEELVSDAYVLATDVLTKLHENGSAWAMADRAVQSAAASTNPRCLANARRRAAIVLRRSQHATSAQQMTVDTAHDFAATSGLATAADAGLYATLLCTASYTAALGGQSRSAYDLLAQAAAVIDEHRAAGFSGNDINLYGIGVARAVGDFGKAVEYARLVHVGQMARPERQARFWEDTALAWWGYGRSDRAFGAMLRAEQVAPQEVRYRPWAQKLTGQLLSAGPAVTPASLREFAARIGIA